MGVVVGVSASILNVHENRGQTSSPIHHIALVSFMRVNPLDRWQTPTG